MMSIQVGPGRGLVVLVCEYMTLGCALSFRILYIGLFLPHIPQFVYGFVMDVSTGVSSGTWIQIRVYLPLRVAYVHIFILRSFPNFLPTFFSISLS